MRVLLVNDLPPGDGGGVEVHLSRLITALEAAGDTVEVFAGEIVHRGPGRLLDVWDPRARRALASRARAFGPDVVHHHNVVRELSVSVLGVPGRARTVLTFHDHRLLGAGDPAGGRWGRVPGRARAVKAGWDRAVARRRVDVAIGVSAAMVAVLRERGFRRVEHVPYFAGATRPADRRPVGQCHDVVFVGRLAPDKGVPVLVDAFRALAAQVPDARLVAVGAGPERGRLEALGALIGRERVVLPGRLDEAGARLAIAQARVVVVPSIPGLRPEGSPIVVVEAALAGRPLVVSDDRGTRELVDLAGCGAVVPAGDAAALAGAIGRMFRDPAAAAHAGEAGRLVAERRHTPEVAVGRLRAIYGGGLGLAPP